MRHFFFSAAIVLLLGLFLVSAQAQEDEDLKKHPGYVDFEGIEIPGESDESVEVYVKGPLLKMVAKASEQEDRELSELLSKLVLIRVNTFSMDDAMYQDLEGKVAAIESNLEKRKWEKMVRVKEKDELVNVYMKVEGDRIVGLVVMALEEGEEAVFVNIVGEIDVEALGKLGGKFAIPQLDSLKKVSTEGGEQP